MYRSVPICTFDTALYVMLLMQANPILVQVGGGWALEILIFWGTKYSPKPNGSMPYFTGPKKVLISRDQPPATCPSTGCEGYCRPFFKMVSCINR